VLARLLGVYQTCKNSGERFTGLVRNVYGKAGDGPPPTSSPVPQP
jgi:hypothetical protein